MNGEKSASTAIGSIRITLPKIDLGVWMPILGCGIGIPLAGHTLLKSFLCDRMGIPPDYLAHRIQTILVNGQAIDDVNQIHMADGDAVALSAAMPGLAGATLRKGSHLADMRRGITRSVEPPHRAGRPCDGCPGVVTLKLFNLVAREMGPKILQTPFLLEKTAFDHLGAHYPNRCIVPETKASDGWMEVHLTLEAFDPEDPRTHDGLAPALQNGSNDVNH